MATTIVQATSRKGTHERVDLSASLDFQEHSRVNVATPFDAKPGFFSLQDYGFLALLQVTQLRAQFLEALVALGVGHRRN